MKKLITYFRVTLAEKDTMRSVFERFDKERFSIGTVWILIMKSLYYRSIWSAAVTCTSILDALLSLALVSSTPGYSWPEILRRSSGNYHNDKPLLIITDKIRSTTST